MDFEAATMKKVGNRLIPLLFICFVVAFVDRVNVGFAALTMNKDLGFTPTQFGLGAGIFFIAYFLLEVPSNLLLARIGARRWIARIMLVWGCISFGMAFVTGANGFYWLRALLGAAEAGFFPGVIFYLTLWFPAKHRAKVFGAFCAAIPFSSVIGAPVSGLLLGLDGALGFKGWQWLFMLEALPAIGLAFVVLRRLEDGPAQAAWLTTDEKTWLIHELSIEAEAVSKTHGSSIAKSLFRPDILSLASVFFGLIGMSYGITFFMPQIVKSLGFSNLTTGFIVSIPFLAGVIAMNFWGRRSDREAERKWHVCAPLLLGGSCLVLAALVSDPVSKIACFSIASVGIYSAVSVFFVLPASLTSGATGAACIAFINSVGNIAGFMWPFAIGYLKELTGGFSAGVLVLAGGGIAAAFLLAMSNIERGKAGRTSLPAAPALGMSEV